jgi:two-component system, NtrC family, nitrogen regulation sensor histidine kinase GlnL
VQRFSGPSERQLVLRCSELVGRSGKPIGRTVLIADETRLRILEDSARRAEHLSSLGEMAASIAHEVRNPLTSLRGCAQELADINRKENNQDATDLATILVNEADRLARIVDDFLTLSRMRKPQIDAVDIGPIFNELRELYERQTDLPAGLRIEFIAGADCPQIAADAGHIRQIVTNLINNAIDAVRHVGLPRISVSARQAPSGHALDGEAVEMSVIDNGCGIPPELQEEIFTPFFSTKSQGTGLGLSLVQRIVKEHEGVMRLASQSGVGTTVMIFLPVHTQTRTYLRALGAT